MIKGDLDTITLKALLYDTSLRYQTVAELIEDLNRYEMDLPLLAKTPKIGYNVNKYFKRNRLMVGFSILSFVLIVAFVALLVVKNKRIQESADKLLVQRNEAKREQKRAETLSDIFIQAFKKADPTHTNSKSVTAMEVMLETEKLINVKFINDPVLRSKLLLYVAEVNINIGEYQKAHDVISFVLGYFNHFNAMEKVRIICVQVLSKMRLGGAEIELTTILERAIGEFGPTPRLINTYTVILLHYVRYDKANKLLGAYFNKLNAGNELYLETCLNYGKILSNSDRLYQAKRVLEKCSMEIDINSNSDLWIKSKLYIQKGQLYLWLLEPKEALANFKKARDVRFKLFGAHHLFTTNLNILIGDALTELNQPNKALLSIEIGLLNQKRFVKTNKDKAKLIRPLFSKAKAYFKLKDFLKAESLYHKIIDLRIQNGSGDLFNTGVYYLELAKTQLKLSKINLSIKSLEFALKIFNDEKYSNDKYNISEVNFYMALSYARIQEFEKSNNYLSESFVDLKLSHMTNDPIFQEVKVLLQLLEKK